MSGDRHARAGGERVTFARRGDIRRGEIRVGWIERDDDRGPVRWRVRLTPASGKPGPLPGDFEKLRHAKMAAVEALKDAAHAAAHLGAPKP